MALFVRVRNVVCMFLSQDLLKVYKETRNGMLGPDYSTKFSPWLAFGCISPRFIYEEVTSFSNLLFNVPKHTAVFPYVEIEKLYRFKDMKEKESQIIRHTGSNLISVTVLFTCSLLVLNFPIDFDVYVFRVLFELIWRDYFRFLSIKCGNSLFHIGNNAYRTKW